MNHIFNFFKSKAILAVVFFGVSGQALAAASGPVLQDDDFTGISFLLILTALIATTAFFFLERDRAEGKWKTSLTVSGMVTLVAAVNYFYMQNVWVETGATPILYRYIDWLITVPLLMIEFYLILAAIAKVPTGIFWRLLIGSLVMLVGGYLGEAGYIGKTPGFIIGMLGWAYILWEIFGGETSKINANQAPAKVQSAYKLMRLIVIFGWAIYPIGYLLGYLTGGWYADSMKVLNILYNFADVFNKITFGVIIWSVAVTETEKK